MGGDAHLEKLPAIVAEDHEREEQAAGLVGQRV